MKAITITNWNYRLVRSLDGTYAIREVHYNARGKAFAMAAKPVKCWGRLRNEVEALPVFVEPRKWAKP